MRKRITGALLALLLAVCWLPQPVPAAENGQPEHITLPVAEGSPETGSESAGQAADGQETAATDSQNQTGSQTQDTSQNQTGDQTQDTGQNQTSGQTQDTGQNQTGGQTQDAGSDTDSVEDVWIRIEDTSIYTGMTKAYKDGYEPEVTNGQVRIVLPVIADDSMNLKELTVTPNLGDTAASPFVYKNYQKTFKATDETVAGTSVKRHVFLISYTFALTGDRMNGTYPVVFELTGKSGAARITQSFTVYVRITDGQSADDGSGEVAVSDSSEETPTSEPKLIITRCTSDPASIQAGDTFTLSVEIQNTSSIKYVQNMTIEVSCGDGGLTLLEDSNTFYEDRLNASETLTLPLTVKADSSLAEGRYDIGLAMSYDNPDAVSLSSSGTLSVAVGQPMRVELEAAQFPESINAGDTISLSIQALNLGRGQIYNVRCTLDIPGLSAGTSAFLGNMEAGSAAGGELKIFAGMKDETVYGEAYGATGGRLILEYEDADGNVYTAEKEVSTTVNPLVISAETGDNTEEEGSGIAVQWIIGVILVLVLIAGGAVLFVTQKRRR